MRSYWDKSSSFVCVASIRSTLLVWEIASMSFFVLLWCGDAYMIASFNLVSPFEHFLISPTNNFVLKIPY